MRDNSAICGNQETQEILTNYRALPYGYISNSNHFATHGGKGKGRQGLGWFGGLGCLSVL